MSSVLYELIVSDHMEAKSKGMEKENEKCSNKYIWVKGILWEYVIHSNIRLKVDGHNWNSVSHRAGRITNVYSTVILVLNG